MLMCMGSELCWLVVAMYCRNYGVHEQHWVCMVCWGLSYIVKFIADGHGGYGSMKYCGVSNAEYLVHLVCMDRLCACREFCGVYSWQNDTRCRDGVKVLWCHSHL